MAILSPLEKLSPVWTMGSLTPETRGTPYTKVPFPAQRLMFMPGRPAARRPDKYSLSSPQPTPYTQQAPSGGVSLPSQSGLVSKLEDMQPLLSLSWGWHIPHKTLVSVPQQRGANLLPALGVYEQEPGITFVVASCLNLGIICYLILT